MQNNPFPLLAQFRNLLQKELFPALESVVEPLSTAAKLLVAVVTMVQWERWLGGRRSATGRIPEDRVCLGKAFLAKAIYRIDCTSDLRVRLKTDQQLRRLCGWDDAEQVPSESTFSRAMAEFARSKVFEKIHATLVLNNLQGCDFEYLARDATAIESRQLLARPKSAGKKAESVRKPAAKKRGRPCKRKRKGGPHKRAKAGERGKRLERQQHMNLAQMLEDLPQDCSWGAKRNSQGNDEYWCGYKLHWDVTYGGRIPVSCILTSANVHDSQVALPLMALSAERIRWKCELMDSAYDARIIRQECRKRGHEAIIKPVRRRRKQAVEGVDELNGEEKERFKKRTIVEQMNGRLKDEFGGRIIYVRRAAKVMTHLMFGILALTVDQLLLHRSG
jgi:hypothetical protein